MHRVWVLCVVAACGFSNVADGVSGDDQPGNAWTKKRRLTINNTSNGPLTNFSLLLQLDATRIDYTATKQGGADVRIGEASGAFFPYEIERWDAHGTSLAWARIPAIAANGTTDVWLYYGNPNASDAQDADAVWDAEYVGVWHMADGKDSTARLQSTNNGGVVVSGRIGSALRFNAPDAHVDTGSAENLVQWTIEAWISPAGVAMSNGSQAMVSKFPNYTALWSCNTPQFCKSIFFNSMMPTLQTHYASFDAPISPNWSYLVGTYDGSAVRAFLNGLPIGQGNSTATPLTTPSTAKIGTHPELSGDFIGDLDEVRISRTARTEAYIKAHARAVADSAYITYGAEEAN